MTAMQQYIADQERKAAEERVSREVYPAYWQSIAKAKNSQEAKLAEALTFHDQPIMSY
jgi:hypothetical protein